MKSITEFRGDYAFLSNFYECNMAFQGGIWKTAEHAYQSCKTDDPHEKERIRRVATPSGAKGIGRYVELREDWEEVKEDAMWQVLRCKFKNPELREQLLATGDAKLVEGNSWGDSYWGKVPYRGKMVGKNRLGKLLMTLRDDLRAQDAGICEHDHEEV